MATFEHRLRQVDADLQAGHLTRARQRLTGMSRTYPEDTLVWDKLAEVCLLQGDRRGAGQALFFSTREDADADALRLEFLTGCPKNQHFARLLGDEDIRTTRLAAPVRARLVALFGDDWDTLARRMNTVPVVGCCLVAVGALLVIAFLVYLAR